MWVTLVDHAVVQLAEFLSSGSVSFEGTDDLSVAMLSLIDRETLSNIVKERYANGLCGRFGCLCSPSHCSLRQEDGVEWFSLNDDREGSDGDERLPVASDETGEEGLGGEEDDFYTAETFRIAQRNRDEMRRARQRAATQSHTQISHGKGSMSRMFCSDDCLATFQSSIVPLSPACIDYGNPAIISSIGKLFPNLRVEALQELAKENVCTDALVGEVVEHGGSGGNTAPLSTSQEGNTKPAATLENFLATAPFVQEVWVSSLQAQPRHRQAWPEERTVVGPLTHAPQQSTQILPLSSSSFAQPTTVKTQLSGSYLVHDFFMTVCGEKCQHLFQAYYQAQRQSLHDVLAEFSPPKDASIMVIIQSIFASLDAVVPSNLDIDAIQEPLVVDAVLANQRRSLVSAHVFSPSSTAALSRLLLFDESTMRSCAWSGVWQSHLVGKTQKKSLLECLVFPFAIPSPLLLSLRSSRESLEMCLIFLLVASCVNPTVLKEFLTSSAQLDEILDATQVSVDDVLAVLCLFVPASDG